MQNHITSGFFALLLLLSGCAGSIRDNDVRDTSIPDMTVKIDSCITIKVEDFDGSKPYNVENVIDSVSFIKLTTEDEAILGAIDQIILMDTCLLVRDTYKTKLVKMFSMSGQFLRIIGNLGQGPGEYVEPTYMTVVENKIAVYDQFTKKILFYGIEGNFIHSLNMPFFSLKFHAFDSNHYLFNTVNSDNDHFKPIYGYSVFDCDSSFAFKSHGFYRRKDSFSSIMGAIQIVASNKYLCVHNKNSIL